MTYQELVQRVIACRHADLELGLSMAREQKPFVEHVSLLLDKAGIEYAVRMSKDFQTTFCVEPDGNAQAAVYSAVSPYYLIFSGNGQFEVASCRPEGYTVRIVFGDVLV